MPALIPDDYLPDVNSRLTLYKRMANCETDNELRELQVEMIDRFGLLPDQVKNLFRQTSLKLKLTPMGIAKLDAGTESGKLDFSADTNINPFTLVKLVQTKPASYKLEGGHTLRFYFNMDTIDRRFTVIEQVLTELQKEL